MTSSSRSPSVQTSTEEPLYDARMDGRRAARPAAVVRARRDRRRVGRPRRRPPAPPAGETRQTPTGLAAFEDAPCYRELIERDGSGGDAS